MAKSQDDFLKKLVQTFKVEAYEHIQKISNLLIEAEQCKTGSPPQSVIEEVFRETHSLKGGARSLNFIIIESLCAELENIFSIWKNKAFFGNKKMFDVFHKALGVVKKLADKDFQDTGLEISIVEFTQIIQKIEIPEEDGISGNDINIEFEEVQIPEVLLPKQETSQLPKSTVADNSVRVNISKLEHILNRCEEFITLQLRFKQRFDELENIQNQQRKFVKQNWIQQGENQEGLLHLNQFNETINQLTESARKLYNDISTLDKEVKLLNSDARMSMLVSCKQLFETFPSMVRDIANDNGKVVTLEITGENIEIDRRILEKLKDPLTHIIRNAIDHGIEDNQTRLRLNKPIPAKISIEIRLITGSKIEILIADDGKGIDTDKIRQNLVNKKIMSPKELEVLSEVDLLNSIFISGLSTSQMVTDLSGRGLGLAIAQCVVEEIGGTITVETKINVGTTFSVKLPVTTSTTRGIFVESAHFTYVLPSMNIEGSVRIKKSELITVESKPAFVFKNRTISLIDLADLLHQQKTVGGDNNYYSIVIISQMGKEVGVLVDQVFQEQEIVVKPLGNLLKRVKFIKGATVVGNGQLVPILNVTDIYNEAVLSNAGLKPETTVMGKKEKQKSILIAEDSITSRMLLKDILESVGYLVTTSVDGAEALALLREHEFDGVVSDVEMPRMNGFDLTTKIRQDEKLRELPVILVTALKTREDRERGLEAGANAYIEKGGFNPGSLLSTLEKLL